MTSTTGTVDGWGFGSSSRAKLANNVSVRFRASARDISGYRPRRRLSIRRPGRRKRTNQCLCPCPEGGTTKWSPLPSSYVIFFAWGLMAATCLSVSNKFAIAVNVEHPGVLSSLYASREPQYTGCLGIACGSPFGVSCKTRQDHQPLQQLAPRHHFVHGHSPAPASNGWRPCEAIG